MPSTGRKNKRQGNRVGCCHEIHIYEKVKVAQLCPTLCNPGTVQSKEFSRPEYWSG